MHNKTEVLDNLHRKCIACLILMDGNKDVEDMLFYKEQYNGFMQEIAAIKIIDAPATNAKPIPATEFKALTGIRPDEIQAFFSQPAIAVKN